MTTNNKNIEESFQPFKSKMVSSGIPSLCISTFRSHFSKLFMGETGMISRNDISPVANVPDLENIVNCEEKGRIALNKAVMIKLNGGLGTSMGMAGPKSLLHIKEDTTFLDTIAKQVLHLRSDFACRFPLLLMNSFSTRNETLKALEKYPDLLHDIPIDFMQHKVPKVLCDNLMPVNWPQDNKKEWCPPGHGDIYTALLTSGILETLIENGFEYAFISNADNLGAVMNLQLLGYFASEKIPFLMEVADRTEADKKGGHLAKSKKGSLVLREKAQCPESEINEFQNINLYKYFNTNNIWINLDILNKKLTENNNILNLEVIFNRKNVVPGNTETPEVYQLETALGSAISLFEGASALRVPRNRFFPVKTTDDLLALWSDLYYFDENLNLKSDPNHSQNGKNIFIKLDTEFFKLIDDFKSRFPKGPPSLTACKSLKIDGDFLFQKGIVCKEQVHLINRTNQQITIPDQTILEGTINY
ncbi:MAG: UTP--glucose-1-phosphate uridylyltransferase [Candidatus Theseobacter exili]|nr:UTP--glucose-1-phosphate uridylyltransferase [Candidatus Theseobacter exili]